eukprot:EC686400.1.p4 GENE.EC686400.1~~EC686400.1.p4  ORF type:complete len:67 (+),score=16.26 EC686400.1:219-419(+)
MYVVCSLFLSDVVVVGLWRSSSYHGNDTTEDDGVKKPPCRLESPRVRMETKRNALISRLLVLCLCS